jgi:integrase
VQILRRILSAALTRAVREELTVRDVARVVELPTWEPAEVISWSSAEALAFLEAARPDPLYPAFVLLMRYGMRRGEVLDLRGQDVDFQAKELRIRQPWQRIQGELHRGPVKTRAGLRKIRVHALRHTTASLLKGLGVPARDAQIILGHAHISTTQQIYTHVDEVARREALSKLNRLLEGRSLSSARRPYRYAALVLKGVCIGTDAVQSPLRR